MYSKVAILTEVTKILRLRPKSELVEIATQLRIGRHTILRALMAHGLNFRSLRSQFLREAIQELAEVSPPLTMKEVAFRLGFPSLSSFSHYLRRNAIQNPVGAHQMASRKIL